MKGRVNSTLRLATILGKQALELEYDYSCYKDTHLHTAGDHMGLSKSSFDGPYQYQSGSCSVSPPPPLIHRHRLQT